MAKLIQNFYRKSENWILRFGRAPSQNAQGRACFGFHFVSAILFPLFSKASKGSAKPFATISRPKLSV
jgi:hypothetical protein